MSDEFRTPCLNRWARLWAVTTSEPASQQVTLYLSEGSAYSAAARVIASHLDAIPDAAVREELLRLLEREDYHMAVRRWEDRPKGGAAPWVSVECVCVEDCLGQVADLRLRAALGVHEPSEPWPGSRREA